MNLFLSSLSVCDFRNLQKQKLNFHPQFNFFWGENGQGKTNFLEALYFLLTLRPLRPVKTKQLIAWDKENALVQGTLIGRNEKRLEVSLDSKSKNLLLNGGAPLSWEDYFEESRIVAFTPEDIQLIRGAPHLRRKFLDRAIFNSKVGYLQIARDYARILSQRNALLKNTTIDLTFFEILNQQFIELGAQVIKERVLLVHRIRNYLLPAFQTIFPNTNPIIDMKYQSSVLSEFPEHTIEDTSAFLLRIQENFRIQIEKKQKKEMERKMSLEGPHLDDVDFFFQEQPFKIAASQGQTRALVLALKIAEIQDIEERTSSHPLFLLDDVAGELDPKHASFLFEFLEKSRSQVLLSTTSLNYIQMKNKNQYPQFEVKNGSVLPQN